jgi:predicted nucleic acid-binding protein
MLKNYKYNIVISDTSCLIILTNINKLDILKEIFNSIEVTPDIKWEYERKGDILPDWLIVKEPNDKELVNKLKKDFKFGGEAEAIVLAKEEKERENNILLILDDADARHYAEDILDIEAKGTLWIISEARKKDILNTDEVKDILTRMKKNNFRISEKVLNKFIENIKSYDEKISNKY